MSTKQRADFLDTALNSIPKKFRTRIIGAYLEIKKRQTEAAHSDNTDSVGISTGKFCESVIRFLQHELTGNSVAFGKHIPNFADACRLLITTPTSAGTETLRIIVPRALVFIYTMRGKRGIGHVGGDIESNLIDMATIVRVSDWVMCELLRVFHNLPLEKAQALLDSLATKDLPMVWGIDGRHRVLNPKMNHKNKVLLLLYSNEYSSALSEELHDWVEHPNMSNFRRDVLRPLHKLKLVEYNEEDEIVYISPTGISEVENNILKDEAV